jgi:predicted peptidase
VSDASAGHRHEVYLPADWTPDRKWPVIVYLHGGGERGEDGVKPTQTGLGPVVWKSGGTFPFVVIFPQAEPGHYWAFPDMEARVMASVDDAIARYAGDPDRVYLTGNSMGGYGTWLIAAHHPGKFAALVPICGGVRPPWIVRATAKLPKDSVLYAPDPYAEVASKIGKTPVWAFHGGSDWMVSPKESRRMVAAMKKQGGDVRYTEYKGVGHDSWDRAYADKALYDWMLAQHRDHR